MIPIKCPWSCVIVAPSVMLKILKCLRVWFLQVIISGSNTAYAGLTTGQKMQIVLTMALLPILALACADCGSPGDILFWERDGGGILHRLQVKITSKHTPYSAYKCI